MSLVDFRSLVKTGCKLLVVDVALALRSNVLAGCCSLVVYFLVVKILGSEVEAVAVGGIAKAVNYNLLGIGALCKGQSLVEQADTLGDTFVGVDQLEFPYPGLDPFPEPPVQLERHSIGDCHLIHARSSVNVDGRRTGTDQFLQTVHTDDQLAAVSIAESLHPACCRDDGRRSEQHAVVIRFLIPLDIKARRCTHAADAPRRFTTIYSDMRNLQSRQAPREVKQSSDAAYDSAYRTNKTVYGRSCDARKTP